MTMELNRGTLYVDESVEQAERKRTLSQYHISFPVRKGYGIPIRMMDSTSQWRCRSIDWMYSGEACDSERTAGVYPHPPIGANSYGLQFT